MKVGTPLVRSTWPVALLLAAAGALVLAPGAARAGVLVTRDGRTLRGALRFQGTEVVIQTEQGRQSFPWAAVLKADFTPEGPETPKPGHGLRGEYFMGRNLNRLSLVRTDARLAFHWDDVLPHPSLCPWGREFSVRWTGHLRPDVSEKYTLIATTDDGVRLWLDGKLLIDRWYDQAAGDSTVDVDLVAGRKYELKIEYFNNQGPGQAMLFWSSRSTPRQVVPSDNLHLPAGPATAPTTRPAAGAPEGQGGQVIALQAQATDGGAPFQRLIASDSSGLLAEYFTDHELNEPFFTRFDRNIDFHYHPDNPPDPAMHPEGSVRWTGFIEAPHTESYQFIVEAHRRVRLWIDGKQVIDRWNAEGGDFPSQEVPMTAGKKVPFKLEYSSPTGFMLCRVRWASRGTAREVVPPTAFSAPTDSKLARPVVALAYPSADALVTAPPSLGLEAVGLSPNGPVQKVEFFDRTGLLGAVSARPFRLDWNKPAPGVYQVRAKLTDSLGVTALSEGATLTVTGRGDGSLRAPWGDFYVANGDYKTPGSASMTGDGAFKIDKAVGTLATDAENDAGHFIVQPLAGDGQIVARIASVEPRDPEVGIFGGITIRESLKNRCKQFSLVYGAPVNDPAVCFIRRQEHWTNPVSNERNVEAPCWVKLVRYGQRVMAYVSQDGKSWDLLGSERFEAAPQVFVGLVAVSREKEKAATATFDHVQVTAGSPPLESTARGFLTRAGTFVAAEVYQVDDNALHFIRHNRAGTVRAGDVARVLYKPMLADHAHRLNPGRSGVLMGTGDFLDGDIKSLKDGQVGVSSVLFGLRKVALQEDVTAVVFRDCEPEKADFLVSTTDQSLFRARSVRADDRVLHVEDVTLGDVVVPLDGVRQIRAQTAE